jgi:hypothetical protein
MVAGGVVQGGVWGDVWADMVKPHPFFSYTLSAGRGGIVSGDSGRIVKLTRKSGHSITRLMRYAQVPHNAVLVAS